MTILDDNSRDLTLDTWDTDYISENWETITLWLLKKEWRGQHSQFLRCVMAIFDDIFYDNFDDSFWWQFKMTIFDDNWNQKHQEE